MYVWAEQGLGDVMQFVPLAAGLQALGADVILEVAVGLVRLCAHSFAGLRVVPRPDGPLTPTTAAARQHHAVVPGHPHLPPDAEGRLDTRTP